MLNGTLGSGVTVAEQQQVVKAVQMLTQVVQQNQQMTSSQRIENVQEVAATIAAVMPMVTQSPAFKRALDKSMAASIKAMASTIKSRSS